MQEGAIIAIGVPHLGNLPGYFVDSILGLERPPGRSKVLRLEGKRVDEARNQIAEAALSDPNVSHLFFLDSDLTVPSGALRRLLSREKDIVGGLYFARTETPVPHFYDEEGTGGVYRVRAKEVAAWLMAHPERHAMAPAHVYRPGPDDLIRCDAIATGCMLISRRVLEAVPAPWFVCNPGTGTGEDLNFCAKARSAGFEVWGDCSVHCGHEALRLMVGYQNFEEVYGVGTASEMDWDEEPVLIGARPLPLPGPVRKDFVFPEDIEGYLTYDEGLLLYRLAHLMVPGTVAVELGAYKGKSTVCLAQGATRVVTVDSFEGEPLLPNTHPDHKRGSYRGELEQNLARYGADWVKIERAKTSDGPLDSVEVGLLFVDAAHDEASVRADVAAWLPSLVPGGIVAFHDVNKPGVEAVVSDLAREGWRACGATGSLVALKKE